MAPGRQLTVACETVPSRPDTYWALKPLIGDMERTLGGPEPLTLIAPGSPGHVGRSRRA
jgi:hypothetical protein